MIHTRAKYQGRIAVGSKARVKTAGWTDTTDRINFPANAARNS